MLIKENNKNKSNARQSQTYNIGHGYSLSVQLWCQVSTESALKTLFPKGTAGETMFLII